MAFRIAEGTRVQAIDENGHWESGRVLKGYSDAALVSFNGYETEHDRIVPRSEIRAPVAYHETVEVTGKRRLSTSSQSPSVKVASLLKLLATDDKLTVVYEGEEQSATLVQVDRFKYQVVVSLGGNNLTLPWQAVVAEADQEDTEPEMPEEQAAEVQAPLKGWSTKQYFILYENS